MVKTGQLKRWHHHPVGIALAPHIVMAAQFETTKRGLAIRQLVQHPLPPEWVESDEAHEQLVTILRRIRKSGGFKGRHVVLQLPSRHCYSLPIHFELGPGQEMEHEMVNQCRRYLTFPVEAAVIDYPSIVMSETGGRRKYSVNIIAAQRSVINTHMQLLERAGFHVAAVDIGIGALLRLHTFLFPVRERPILLCHIGQQHSLLGVVDRDRIIALRHIHWGMDLVIHHLNRNLGFDTERGYAAIMLTKYGLAYEKMCKDPMASEKEKDPAHRSEMAHCRTVFQVLSSQLNLLIHEFHQLMGYVRSELKQATIDFEQVNIYGPSRNIRHLDKFLQARLNIPARTIEPLNKVMNNHALDAVAQANVGGFDMAMGLAMREVPWL